MLTLSHEDNIICIIVMIARAGRMFDSTAKPLGCSFFPFTYIVHMCTAATTGKEL